MAQLTLFAEAPRANPSRSPAFARALLTHGEISPSPSLRSLTDTGLATSSGKMSLASCHQTEEGISLPSSEAWGNWGTGGLTGCWTRSMSEWTGSLVPSRNDDGVCSLSDILVTGDVPQRYFLSPKACSGILRRAEKRGKDLPSQLHAALLFVAGKAGEPLNSEKILPTPCEHQPEAATSPTPSLPQELIRLLSFSLFQSTCGKLAEAQR